MHIYITKYMKFELDHFLNFREISYFQTISNRQKTKFGINLHNLKYLINAARNTISGNEGELSKLDNQKQHGTNFYVI